jgi:hypothetical protein
MAIRQDGYYYDAQITKYINQFMAIFQGLQVQIGKRNSEEERLIPVEIRYAPTDKVVASILTDNTQNKPIKLPAMSAFVSGFALSMGRARGVGAERRNTFVPVGGLIPNDMQVIHQRMPVPYDLTIELNIYASNTNQQFQILEQILPLFDPSLSFQTSDAPFDWTRLTCVTLKDVTLDTNFPVGVDRRIIQSKLVFEMPIEFQTPADVRKDFVEKVFLRIGTVGAASVDNYEIIAELDGQGLPYELVATDETFPFS